MITLKVILLLFLFIINSFTILAQSQSRKCHVHQFVNLESSILSKFGSDIVLEDFNGKFLEFDLNGITSQSYMNKIYEKILSHDNINDHMLVLYLDNNHYHPKFYHDLCHNSNFKSVRAIISKDYDLNKFPITAGQYHSELSIAPERCSNEFTGETDQRNVNIGLGISFSKKTSFHNLAYDFVDYPIGIKGEVPDHFILIGSPSRSLTYGCSRSHPVNPYNLQMFFKFIKTKAKYNLYSDSCDFELPKPAYFVSYFIQNGEKKLFYMKTSKCSIFLENLERAKLINVDFDFSDYESGWNPLSSDDYSKKDYDILNSILTINYGYSLKPPTYINHPYTVAWIKEISDLKSCITSCFFIRYSSVEDLELSAQIAAFIKDFNLKLKFMSEIAHSVKYMFDDNTKSFKKKEKENDKMADNSDADSSSSFIKRALQIDLPPSHIGPTEHYIVDTLFSAYHHSKGLVTVDHFERVDALRVKTFYECGEPYHLNERNIERDYRIYGSKPYIGSPTRRITYNVKDTQYDAQLFGQIGHHYYALTWASPVSGLSGAPIFNDKGEFLSIYSETKSFFSHAGYRLSDLKNYNDISSKLPTILKFPIIESDEKIAFEEPIDFSDKTEQISMKDDLPIKPGYYELTAPLGSGKSTIYPKKLERSGFNVWITEPYVGLARQVAERNNFSCKAEGSFIDRNSKSMVSTAGSLNQIIHRQQIDKLKKYSAILIDEDHSENADTLFLVEWAKNYAKNYGLVIIGMSATHRSRMISDTSHEVYDVQIEKMSSLNSFLHPNINALLFSPKKSNPELEKMAKDSGMEIILYNADTIEEDPDLPVKLQKKLSESKGYAVIATKVAEMGFNAPIDVCFTSDQDTTQIFSDKEYQRYEPPVLSRVKISLPNYYQRRGRVGRNRKGTFVFLGEKPNHFNNRLTVDQFRADMRLQSLHVVKPSSILFQMLRFCNTEDSVVRDIRLWENSWNDDLSSLFSIISNDPDDTLSDSLTFDHFSSDDVIPPPNNERFSKRSFYSFYRHLLFNIFGPFFYSYFVNTKHYKQISSLTRRGPRIDLGPILKLEDKFLLDIVFNSSRDPSIPSSLTLMFTDFSNKNIPFNVTLPKDNDIDWIKSPFVKNLNPPGFKFIDFF